MQINKQNILFRVDSSYDIGTGHIMRDLVLAKKFEGAKITFATQNLEGNINHKILEENHNLEILKSNNKNELVELIKKLQIDMVVFDSYDIDYEFEKFIKEQTDVKIMSLDDAYEKHYCDILLNHNVYAKKSKYKGLVPEKCLLQCGVRYTLLRDEFLHIKTRLRDIGNRDRIKIFVAMGGADSKNMNIALLEALKNLNVNIQVVTTKANQNLLQLMKYIDEHTNIHLHVNSENLARIIDCCDMAIVTPSVIVNEILFLKIPFISIMVADNQLNMYEYLKERGMLCLKSSEIRQLHVYVNELSSSEKYINQIKIITNIVNIRLLQ